MPTHDRSCQLAALPMQALGLRSQRKPAGYWDDEMNLGGCSCKMDGWIAVYLQASVATALKLHRS